MRTQWLAFTQAAAKNNRQVGECQQGNLDEGGRKTSTKSENGNRGARKNLEKRVSSCEKREWVDQEWNKGAGGGEGERGVTMNIFGEATVLQFALPRKPPPPLAQSLGPGHFAPS